MADSECNSPSAAPGGQYVVVARRYRPQSFDALVGQEHVAKALKAAISTDRVGHAYLFTGARGVGKTSAARILAKALCCVNGPTENPCGECDICQSIAAGGDVDVLEIDGASNRGIEEIRQLRSNVGIRPSRARYKIYIIDEVHMLTREAFNALLKTLEEPPEHVKFIFCTTEATKIPVTVLSRCQRFDFAGIQPASIAAHLAEIVRNEGLQAEPEALAILARRAAGSMRDSQSLLEQLLSVTGQEIRVADVHALLGTADTQRLLKLAEMVASGDTAGALGELDSAIAEGADVGEMLEQLLSLLRDAMTALAGCGGEVMQFATSTAEQQAVQSVGQSLGLERVLAMLQIVEETLSRLRYSTHRRTLAEVALVRLCKLEDLDSIAALAAQLAQGDGALAAPRPAPQTVANSNAASGTKKKALAEPLSRPAEPLVAAKAPVSDGPSPAAGVSSQTASTASVANGCAAVPAPSSSLSDSAPYRHDPPHQVSHEKEAALSPPLADDAAAEKAWNTCLNTLAGLVEAKGKNYQKVALRGSRLEVTFSQTYNFCKSFFDQHERKRLVEQTLAQVVGAPVQVDFVVGQAEKPSSPAAEAVRVVSPAQRLRAIHENPLVSRAVDLFGSKIDIVE